MNSIELTREEFVKQLNTVFPTIIFNISETSLSYAAIQDYIDNLMIEIYFNKQTKEFLVDVTSSDFNYGTAKNSNLKQALDKAIIDLGVNIEFPDEDW